MYSSRTLHDVIAAGSQPKNHCVTRLTLVAVRTGEIMTTVGTHLSRTARWIFTMLAMTAFSAALAQPDDLEALAEQARLHDASGLPMAAYRDRLQILQRRPGDVDTARLAAADLADAGAPQAAAAFLARHPAALSGEAGAALARRIAGDLAARRVRWGWAEPVVDPSQRRHEADAAIAALTAMHQQDPRDPRATGDLLLAYRLADRMADVVALWEKEARRDDAPYWLRNAAADAYLALHRPAEAEALYRSFAGERAAFPEPWLGLYWAAIEQRHYRDAEAALAELAKIPGQELTAKVQQGWLLLFEDRTAAAQAHFEALMDQEPGDRRVREGLATAYLWQGFPRRGLQAVDELLARTTLAVPPVDNPSARIARAGALSALGDLASARREADDLVALYPENSHAERLRRDLHTQLAPEVRLEGRYDTSDRGLSESWSQLEVSVPLGTRARLAAGGWGSRSEDERYSAGDVLETYLGLSLRPERWLSVSAEAAWDVSGEDLGRGPAASARMVLLPDDRWRVDLGLTRHAWRDLPLRARAAGIVADTYDAGFSHAGTRWNARFGGGRSDLSDGNLRTWGLVAANLLATQGPVYRGTFGIEAYASTNRRSDVAYFSPARDGSLSLTHRSEWVTANAPGHRHSFSLFGYAGVYSQEGFDAGPVGGLWLESDWDLSGRTVLVAGAGARSQLYDGTRELDPRIYLTLRRRF
jgi:biofilm PGA synthesis protein PgaA